MQIRHATHDDVKRLCELDHIARTSLERHNFISKAILGQTCYVVAEEGKIVAYGVLDYSFYGNGFIAMLYVSSEHRRKGIGRSLVEYFERINTTPKLFTSTNQSNIPMQNLLEQLSFLPSGFITNLDEGDDELVYYKRLRD